MQTAVLPTALAWFAGNRDHFIRERGRALIDGGAQTSVVSRAFIDRIYQYQPESVYLHRVRTRIAAVGGAMVESPGQAVLSIIQDDENTEEKKIFRFEVLVVEDLDIWIDGAPGVQDLFPGVTFADDISRRRRVDIILGQNVIWRILKDRIIHSDQEDFVCQESILGWLPQGGGASWSLEKAVTSTVRKLKAEKSESPADAELKQEVQGLVKVLKDFMSLENIGIEPTQENELSAADRYAVEFFLEHLEYDDVSRTYTSRLIFSPGSSEVINNRRSAEKRLASLARKFQADPSLRESYSKAMEDYFLKGDAEWIAPEDAEPANAFYLPHSGVWKDSATTQIRIVFDGSSPDPSGVSINGRLCTGPQGNPDLLKLLHGFRQSPVALCGDISRMYLAVNLHPDDRKFMRFLWWKDGKVAVANMKKITFGIADSSFQATETLCHHARKFLDNPDLKETVEILLNKRWVDDMVCSVDTEEKAQKTLIQCTEIMESANFHFRKWMSNSPDLMQKLKTEDRADLKDPIDFGSEDDQGRWLKALGLKWNPKLDIVAPVTEMELSEKEISQPTRRTVASGMAQLFDPLGILSPVAIIPKILNQEIWQEVVMSKHPTKQERKQVWREPLTKDQKTRWDNWRLGVQKLQGISIPRFISSTEKVAEELHVFSDASPWAMGAVMYKLSTLADGKKMTTFVVAKCKVAPKKKEESLARLELVGALMGARLLDHFRTSTGEHIKATLWTDSAITYMWLQKHHSHWLTFVARRVEEIKQLLKKEDNFRHIPGVDNVADLLTRGIPAEEFIQKDEWFHGPKWLRGDPNRWPANFFATAEAEREAEKEQKKAVVAALVQKPLSKGRRWELLQVLQEKFSNYGKLLRMTAYLFRVVHKLPQRTVEVLPEEIEEAQMFWVKKMQIEKLKAERQVLAKGEEIPESMNKQLRELTPYLDKDGVMRVGGRLDKSDLPQDMRHPMILPKGHPVVRRLIRYVHNSYLHQGVGWTFFHLRHRFWLLGGRREVISALGQCTICKRWNGKTKAQQMAPLPDDRVKKADPFERIGVDFAGPFIIREEDNSEGKVWVVLFVCMVTRAVHTDVVKSLRMEDFLNAFRRLVAQFGRPRVMWSDNARTFTASAQEFGALWSPSSLKAAQKKLVQDGTKWNFISPSSPWQGGSYERLVGMIKAPFKKSFRGTKYDFDTFRTCIAECEAVVNSRPLGFVSEQKTDLLPITPAMLVMGYSPCQLRNSGDLLGSPQSPAGRWKDRLQSREKFQERFIKDYMLQLMKSEKWQAAKENVKVGDVVLIAYDNKPRGFWPLALIVNVYPASDGKVRNVLVKTSSGLFRRSIQRLVPLEVSSNEPVQLDLDESSSVPQEDEENAEVAEEHIDRIFSLISCSFEKSQ